MTDVVAVRLRQLVVARLQPAQPRVILVAKPVIGSGSGGGGGGAVDSVNTQTGVVVLDAGDIGFTAVGTIAATNTQAAVAEVAIDAAAALTAHTAASDPHPGYLTAAEGAAAYEPLGAVASEASTRSTAVSAEASTRATADTTLQTNITAEAASRTTADALKANIASPTFTGTVTVPSGAVLGTPTSVTLTNATGLPESGVTSLVSDLAAKAPLASPTFTGTVTIPSGASITAPTGLVKGDVGLGSVDNTADTAKPVSTAQQTALNLKSNIASPTFTGTVTVPSGAALGTPTSLTLTNATGLPESGVTNLTSDLALKAPLASPTFTGTVTIPSGAALGTPTSVTLTSATGLPISTGVSGLASGAATFLATPSSANLATLLTDETGSGANVHATSPTLVTPALGTPSAVDLTNATNIPDSAAVKVIARQSYK